jgi:hypothetical protein
MMMNLIELTHEETKEILDGAREGYPYPETLILKCLNITGDYRAHEELRSERLDEEAQDQDWRARVRQRAIMVGRSKK